MAPGRAGLAEFRMADSWPSLMTGVEVVHGTAGMNIPIAGALAAAQASGRVTALPVLWCAAEPSDAVTDEGFDTITGQILDGLRAQAPLDAVYLDLHGAMVT